MEHIGTVFLVGAGPGDPDLLTVRAARLIASATVIVHDGLVDPAILALAPLAKLISVAKYRSRHTMTQDAINELLIDLARDGHDVVRLKGVIPLSSDAAAKNFWPAKKLAYRWRSFPAFLPPLVLPPQLDCPSPIVDYPVR